MITAFKDPNTEIVHVTIAFSTRELAARGRAAVEDALAKVVRELAQEVVQEGVRQVFPPPETKEVA